MKYRVSIEGVEREVDVVVLPDGGVRVLLDGENVEADVVLVPGGISLRLDSRIYDIAIGGKPESLQIAAGSSRATAQIVSERMRSRGRRTGPIGTGAKELRAPMPGRVVKILVGAGDSVAAGDPCVVVEAMKMENELRAPIDAKVASVHVSEGSSVEGNALLVSFE